MDFFRELAAPAMDELVIAVPKFYLPRIPRRRPRRRPLRAEQLVEVPTIFSYSSLQQRIAEQLIDIPVPHDRGGRGGGGGLQGFSQGQGATAFSSSSWSWWLGRSWRPSRFLPGTEFNSGLGAER